MASILDIVFELVDRIETHGYQIRAKEDEFYEENQKRIAAEKDRDHWKTARQDAIAAGELMQAEIETLKGAMAADDKRLRDAEERVWPGETRGCDAPDAMADEILSLRTKLVDSRVANINLQGQLAAARAEIERLRGELEAATAAVTLQRQGIEPLRAFVEKIRDAHHFSSLASVERALRQLDDQPTPATEPALCPECERWKREVERINSEFVASKAELIGLRGHLRKFQAFVGKVRSVIDNDCDGLEIDEMIAALDELDDETTPVAEQAEGGK